VPGVIPGTIDIQGQVADVCARMMNLALPGQILLTRHAYDDGHQFVREHPPETAGGVSFELRWRSHGRFRFKSKEHDPLEVFEVGAIGFAPLAPPDRDKARRVIDRQYLRQARTDLAGSTHPRLGGACRRGFGGIGSGILLWPGPRESARPRAPGCSLSRDIRFQRTHRIWTTVLGSRPSK
jgi:hypothetical protein